MQQFQNGASKKMKNKKTVNKQYAAMSSEYWKLWNDDVQAKIDNDIETNRKANAKPQAESR